VSIQTEIAYFISEDYCSKGYTSEAAKALADWTFANLNPPYLIAIVEPDNISSQKVLEKCGFTKQNTIQITNSGDREAKPFFYYRLYKNT
jgi:[ribosomal protein S5]-alanine N-acetyltransferase